jgi:hypothetical protein
MHYAGANASYKIGDRASPLYQQRPASPAASNLVNLINHPYAVGVQRVCYTVFQGKS